MALQSLLVSGSRECTAGCCSRRSNNGIGTLSSITRRLDWKPSEPAAGEGREHLSCGDADIIMPSSIELERRYSRSATGWIFLRWRKNSPANPLIGRRGLLFARSWSPHTLHCAQVAEASRGR